MKLSASPPLHRCYPRISDRCYVRSKLSTDPLYPAAADALTGETFPLLDIGCGLGLFALYLRSRGMSFPITGLDFDERKIASAREALEKSGATGVAFSQADARAALPAHEGNVAILDILQFFLPDEQESLLRRAASCLPPGGKLVIRSGLRDQSARYSITHAADLFSRAAFWMKSAPVHYPTEKFFRGTLSRFGGVSIRPLWGNTPFNNYLVILTRAGSVTS